MAELGCEFQRKMRAIIFGRVRREEYDEYDEYDIPHIEFEKF